MAPCRGSARGRAPIHRIGPKVSFAKLIIHFSPEPLAPAHVQMLAPAVPPRRHAATSVHVPACVCFTWQPRRSVSHACAHPRGGHNSICPHPPPPTRFPVLANRAPFTPTRMHGATGTNRWLEQVGPTTTCAIPDLLCKQIKKLQHISKTY